MDWQEEKHVPVSCLWTVAVVAFYLAILQFKISSLCRLTDHGRTAICSKSLARRTKPREEQWCVGRGLFDGVSILWVAHPIVVHGPGVRRRVLTSEVRVSGRSAVLHALVRRLWFRYMLYLHDQQISPHIVLLGVGVGVLFSLLRLIIFPLHLLSSPLSFRCI